jgi:uncharacterized protein (DUF433 family)
MLDLAYQPLSEMLSQDPKTVGGELHFTGTRVPLSTVLDNLAVGETLDRILYNYPTLSRRHLLAVLAWEAELARQ